MRFARPIESIEDFVSALKAREGVPVRILDGVVTPIDQIPEQTVPVAEPTFPVVWL